MGRSAILAGVIDHVPRLAKWFQWAYSTSAPLIYFNGEVVGQSATGVRQGDPLAALCFCTGLQAPLVEIMELVSGHTEDGKIGILAAYMDDIRAFVGINSVNMVIEGIKEICANRGLILSPEKCKILLPPNQVWPEDQPAPDFPLVEDGLISMGNPTGSPEYCKAQVEAKLTKAAHSLPALERVSPWIKMRLIRDCIIARSTYLATVSEYSSEALLRFDEKIDNAILSSTHQLVQEDDFNYNGEEDEVDNISLFMTDEQLEQRDRQREEFKRSAGLTKILRSLPLALGGLGMHRYSGTAGEVAKLRSRETMYDFVLEYQTLLVDALIQSYHGIEVGKAEDAWFRDQMGMIPAEDEEDDEEEEAEGAAVPPFSTLVMASGEFAFPPYHANDSPEQRRIARTARQNTQGPNRSAVTARFFHKKFQRKRAERIVQFLAGTGKEAEAIWFKSSWYKGSGRWMIGVGGQLHGKFAFKDALEYKMAIRLRLLLSPLSSDLGDMTGTVLCNCGMSVNIKSLPYHALDCSCSQWYFHHRHNAVRDLLEDFARQNLPRTSAVYLEPKVYVHPAEAPSTAEELEDLGARRRIQRQRNNGQQSLVAFLAERAMEQRTGTTRADLSINTPDTRQYIDVVVSNPAAITYRTKATGLMGTNGVASVDRASAGNSFVVEHWTKTKQDRYYHILGRQGVEDPAIFVPFIVEATGKMSPPAELFISTLLSESRDFKARSTFNTLLGASIARNNAMAVLAWVRKILVSSRSPH
jgi:hypothetical protein